MWATALTPGPLLQISYLVAMRQSWPAEGRQNQERWAFLHLRRLPPGWSNKGLQAPTGKCGFVKNTDLIVFGYYWSPHGSAWLNKSSPGCLSRIARHQGLSHLATLDLPSTHLKPHACSVLSELLRHMRHGRSHLCTFAPALPPRNVFLLVPGPLQLPSQLGTLRHLSGPQSESHITPHPRGEPHVSPHHKLLY